MRKSMSVWVVSLVLACLAIVGVASPASAVVQAGVVGGGIHNQYGPQDAGGNYMGIASESYDFYSDALWGFTGWGDNFPTWSGAQRPPDGIGYGYVLLAFNPYTGEVWNDIPATHQALNPAGTYSGHTPTVGLTGVDGNGDPVSSDVVTEDLARGYAEDTVYITGAFIPRPNDGVNVEPFGSFVNTSADGGILGVLSGSREVAYNTSWGALLPDGAEVKTYAAGDGDRPGGMYGDPGGDLDFDHNKTWGYTGFWNWRGWYAGDEGGVADSIFGFEMDGIKGWMRLDFAANHSGVRLTEYYFDLLVPGDFDGDGDVDADDIDILCDNLGDVAYDLDGDGDADEDDMIFLIETLVELQDASGRVGTRRGDFNLDGFVDGTDLALMKTAFGQPGQSYADGNANCDAFVDGTDLAILKTNFGFIALPSPGGVPEPATLALLTMGGLTLLRRRRK
ncbi:hypothetical protein LCGC14_0276800 [marine sediment metagenome]|uniref:Ice-binding protein C-terminal domain-containing protein n=1 Tax=marine sediment metagenome TaxID=412755 RepID=A0A0F9WIB6_9ZZZZ